MRESVNEQDIEPTTIVHPPVTPESQAPAVEAPGSPVAVIVAFHALPDLLELPRSVGVAPE